MYNTFITSPDDSCPFIFIILPGSGQSANFSLNNIVSDPSLTRANRAQDGRGFRSSFEGFRSKVLLRVLELRVPCL